jgi:hypothetical protein
MTARDERYDAGVRRLCLGHSMLQEDNPTLARLAMLAARMMSAGET